MRIRITLILVLCLSFLCLPAQERYDFVFRGVSIEQALMQIEDETGVSIIYNPREVSANKRISLTLSGITAEETIRQVLGHDYRIQQKNGIFTIKKEVPKAPIPSDKSETLPLSIGKGPAESIERIEEIESIEELSQPDRLETLVSPLDTLVSPDTLAPQETPVVSPTKQNLYQPTAHRVMTSIAAGYGNLARVGSATTIFDAQYAYFFHENWGIAAGAGINYFSKPKQQTDAQLLTLYMPVTFRMDYRLLERLRLIGSAGASLELPIAGAYGTDDLGERYSESILYGAIADIGVAVPLARTNHLFYALGISAYGQCVFTSSGAVKDELHHQDIIPWQVGLRLSLLLNIRE